tara:strand:- start:184 stop:465 length:282 start_codon:yes stop_codon:yes gene_type:complete
MSKIGNLVIQAQEDAVDGMTLPNFLEEYGGDSLWIWEQVNGEAPDELEFLNRKREGEEIFSDTPMSSYGKSIQEQSDREVQQEHWQHERWSDF